jgi:hypothetical protein
MSDVTASPMGPLRATPLWVKVARVLVVFAALFWILLSARFLAMWIFVAFIASLLISPLRRGVVVPSCLLALAVLSTWTPLDVTFENPPGAPRVVQCCPITSLSLSEHLAALARQERGECMACSDLLPPTGHPKWYVVW